jgi:hypothetical protein
MHQTLNWGICNSRLARCVHFWGVLRKVSHTCSTVSTNDPSWPVRFTVHRQLLCSHFMYHSRIVLSIGGSVWYVVWNLCCSITIDSVLANSKTHRMLSYPPSLPCFVTSAPPSGTTCKYAMVPITQTNFVRHSTYWYAPFCCVCLGCCVAKFKSSGGTYELPCMNVNVNTCIFLAINTSSCKLQ